MDSIRAKLESLGYEPAAWQRPVTEQFLAAFESDSGLTLPTDYRKFLLEVGAWSGSATCDFLEARTPLGEGGWVDLFYGDSTPDYECYGIRWATEALGALPHFITIAGGGMNGCLIAIRCGGFDTGAVYFVDADQRSLWPDEMFFRMFPGLDPSICEYLELRKAGKLPKKPDGYENLYPLARTFTEFIHRLKRSDDE